MKQSRYVLDDNQISKENKIIHIAKNFITETLLISGILGLFSCFISENSALISAIISAVVMLIILNVIQFGKSKILKALPYILGVLTVVVNPVGFSRALLGFCNQLIEVWNRCFNTLLPRLKVSGILATDNIQFFVFIFIFISILIFNQVRKNKIIITSVMVILCIVISAVFELAVPLLAICLMILGWIMNWCAPLLGSQKLKTKAIIAVSGIVLLAALFIFCSSYSGSLSVTNTRTDIKTTAEHFWYGNDTLPQGNMTKANQMSIPENKKDTLEISFNKAQQMYLKGFVGSKFNGISWDTLEYSDYTEEEIAMVKWLRSRQTATQFQYSTYLDLTTDKTESKEYFSVKNIGASRKYIYSPYEANTITDGSYSLNNDYQVKSKGLFGTENYSFSAYKNVDSAESIIQKSIDFNRPHAAGYNEFEQVYRSFVNSNYLDVPERAEAEINSIFYKDYDVSNATLYDLTEQIREILQKSLTYTENPEYYSGENEFISWIFEQKEGNSAYFATVATLAYRAAGIPARYTEGYTLSAARATMLNDAHQASTNLTTDDAHAWVEVYLDGIGWMPVEVIPGFYYAEYTSKQNSNTPDSSVNIVNKTDENMLQGATSDSIATEPADITKDKTEKQSISPLSVIIIILVVLAVSDLIFILRYFVLVAVRKNRLNKMNSVIGSRTIYKHTMSVMKSAGFNTKPDFPYENIPFIIENYPEITVFECTRFIELVQKVVFGEEELSEAEYATVKKLDEKLTLTIYSSLGKWAKFKMKYFKVLI